MSTRATNERQRRWMRYGSIALFVVAVFLLMQALPTGRWIDAMRSWIESTGPWGPLIFGGIYVLAVVALVPGSALTIASGVLFGLVVGTIVVSIASTVGAACAFLIARYLARSRVEQLVADNPKFKAMDDAVAEGGWKIVAMLRLSPAVPFNLQNYLYGLTQIRFWTCALTSWGAMLPGTFMYVYFGHISVSAATDVSDSSGDRGRSTLEWIALAVGLLATIALTVYLTRIARRKLQEQSDIAAADDKQANGSTTASADESRSRDTADAQVSVPAIEWIMLATSTMAVVGGVMALVFSESIEQLLTNE